MYSTRDAGKILGLSQDHVKLLARKGLLKAQKVGRDWIILDLDYTRKRKPKETDRERDILWPNQW